MAVAVHLDMTADELIEHAANWWAIYFDRRDWWIGVYLSDRAIYVCPLPCLVIRRMRA